VEEDTTRSGTSGPTTTVVRSSSTTYSIEKIRWLLTAQGLLLAAYGITFRGTSPEDGLDRSRTVVAISGLSMAAIVLLGALALIHSKYRSWKEYRVFFDDPLTPSVPRPLDRRPLQWVSVC
jgi:hypothetical protein